MPFIKVNFFTEAPGVKPGYLNSDQVLAIIVDGNRADIFLERNHRACLTLDSLGYFLSEVDTRDAQVNVSDIPERSLASRIASVLRDNYPTGASFRDLFAQFPDNGELKIANAIAELRREQVINVLEDGIVIHKSNALTPSPDLSTEDASNDSDLPDDTAR